MDANRVVLAPGDNVLEGTIQDVRIPSYAGNVGIANLRLTIRSLPMTAKKHQEATTLEVSLERDAAMKLLYQLHVLSNEMGWPIERVIGR